MRKRTSVLNPYVGPLDAAKIADGMNAAIQNSHRLVEDAKLLFDAGRHPTALSIAILAIEEACKVAVLRRIAVSCDGSEIKNAWREYRSHRAKNAAWIIAGLAAKGARTLDSLAECVNVDGEHTAILDALKQVGFYTDCLGKQHWSKPYDVIEAELCQMIVTIAEILSRTKREVTTREIELWIEHMGPHRRTKDLRNAILEWHAAMVAEGLTNRSTEWFKAFVEGTPYTAH